MLRPAAAQEFEPGMRTAFLADFDRTAGKFLALAEAFDPAHYDWRPGPGVRSVREVFAVLIGENGALMPESFATAPLPGFVAGQNGFAAIRTALDTASKTTIVSLLKASFEVNRTAWASAPATTLGAPHPFFGGEAPASRIALTMLVDQHEHLGQLIAYARANGVVPPWSRPRTQPSGDSLAARMMSVIGGREVWAAGVVDHILAVIESPQGGGNYIVELWTRWDRPGTISWVRTPSREQVRIFDGNRGWTATRNVGEVATVTDWAAERVVREQALYRGQFERTIHRIAARDPRLSFGVLDGSRAGWLDVREDGVSILAIELGPDGAPVRALPAGETTPFEFGPLAEFGNHRQPGSGVAGGTRFRTVMAELLPSAAGLRFGRPEASRSLDPSR
ncbi:MAG: DinB family protein [Gemmatimonadales bacterium]